MAALCPVSVGTSAKRLIARLTEASPTARHLLVVPTGHRLPLSSLEPELHLDSIEGIALCYVDSSFSYFYPPCLLHSAHNDALFLLDD